MGTSGEDTRSHVHTQCRRCPSQERKVGRFFFFFALELTLRGILMSRSGNEITPIIFPALRTTTVASICSHGERGAWSVHCTRAMRQETPGAHGNNLTWPIPTHVEDGKLRKTDAREIRQKFSIFQLSYFLVPGDL